MKIMSLQIFIMRSIISVHIDLSAFYLDFAKDVLYIEAKDQNDRRAIQTVYMKVYDALTKLVSPILSHTADEVWSFIPCCYRGKCTVNGLCLKRKN